jgi:hypothetical protein
LALVNQALQFLNLVVARQARQYHNQMPPAGLVVLLSVDHQAV